MINRSNVISGGTSNQHVVEGYRFKVISEFDNHVVEHHLQNSNEENDKRTHEDVVQENQSIVSTQTIQESQIQTFQPNLLKIYLKTDEMSSNIIKLQMQIESQENEFNNRLNSELENAKEKFTKEGFDKAKE